MRQDRETTGFQRHVRACNNAAMPGGRIPFVIEGQGVGWVPNRVASVLSGISAIECTDTQILLTDPSALPGIALELSKRGLYRFRDELFDVRAKPDGPVLAQIDRGAIPSFGIAAAGVHLNGLVSRPDGLHLWIARRGQDRPLDPGKLDNIVAGGIPAGLSPAQTLLKEAAEEAAIPQELASRAVPVGAIGYVMERSEGLRRDWLYCYDLVLQADFTPAAADGEVEAFELWPLRRVVDAVRESDVFKFNVNLVLLDLFVRKGAIVGAEADQLKASLTLGNPGWA